MIVVVYWSGAIYCPIKTRLNHRRTITETEHNEEGRREVERAKGDDYGAGDDE